MKINGRAKNNVKCVRSLNYRNMRDLVLKIVLKFMFINPFVPNDTFSTLCFSSGNNKIFWRVNGLRGMSLNLKRFSNLKLFKSKILYIFLWTGWIKEHNWLWTFMLKSKSNNSLSRWKKGVLETIYSTIGGGYTIFPCSGGWFIFRK